MIISLPVHHVVRGFITKHLVVCGMENDRERTDSGQFTESVTDYDIWSFIFNAERPFQAAGDVAEHFDIDRSQAYRRLQRMSDDGELRKEKVGARAVVWWIDLGECERCGEWATDFRSVPTPMKPTDPSEEAPEGDLSNVHDLCQRCAKEYDRWEGDYSTMNQFLDSEPEGDSDREETGESDESDESENSGGDQKSLFDN
jgi:hypothetical protein